MERQVTLAIVGAGHRGSTYADLAAMYGHAKVAAVADPDPGRRNALADAHGVPAELRFAGWEELVAAGKVADAAVVATQDHLHHAPALALIEQGYHLLLEKPVAPTEEQCLEILQAAEDAKVILAVCHVLRYTPYSLALQELVASGAVGDIVSVEHLEPVGWWHHAHSYVRGNWRREETSSFMLMAKSVHDIDWLNHLIGREPQRVSSFGGLYHFRPEQKPEGAADRCLDCAIESTCPYSAPRLYLSCLGDPDKERWPLSTVTPELTPEGVLQALRTGPYGRCVYSCDNDVVDHQVVSIEYAGGVTASFTMTAFTEHEFRRTRIFGTHGCVTGNGHTLELTDFRNGQRSTIEVPRPAGPSLTGGHGGGDYGLVRSFVDALRSGDPQGLLPDARDSIASHQLTWAAERARRTGAVVAVTDLADHPA